MNPKLFCPISGNKALEAAEKELIDQGLPLVRHPAPDVTHLLLPVPAFTSGGAALACTASALQEAPPGCTVLGGRLTPAVLSGHPLVDLLQDPLYLNKNAAITAHCALTLAAPRLPVIWSKLPVLILGWGRIGQHLARLLQGLGACVTIAARRPEARAMAASFGYEALSFSEAAAEISRYRLIYNTVPAPVLDVSGCPDCLAIELASVPGMTGTDIVDGRALPGRLAPESSGLLIAETILRRIKEEEK